MKVRLAVDGSKYSLDAGQAPGPIWRICGCTGQA